MERLKRTEGRVARAVLLAMVLALPGCGGGGGNSPTSVPAPVRTLVQSGEFRLGSIQDALAAGLPFDAGRVDFATSGTGTLEVVVDWTFATNDVDIGIYRGTCSFNQFYSAQCPEVASTSSATAKPERLALNNLAGGTYTLIIVNLGVRSESGNYQIYLTR